MTPQEITERQIVSIDPSASIANINAGAVASVIINTGATVSSAAYSGGMLSTSDGLLIDSLGFYIVDTDGNYINIGGGVQAGAETAGATYTGGTITDGSYSSGLEVTSEPLTNGTVTPSDVTVGSGITEASWVLGS